MEGLLEDARHEPGLARHDRPFGDGLGDLGDLDGLEVLLVEPGARRLAGDAEDGDRIRGGGIEAGDHVGAGGAGRADANPDVAGAGAREALGHVRRALHVAREHVADGVSRPQRRVERIDGRAGNAEGLGDAFFLHHENRGGRRRHPGHERLPFEFEPAARRRNQFAADARRDRQ